jgi:hypothetical protein
MYRSQDQVRLIDSATGPDTDPAIFEYTHPSATEEEIKSAFPWLVRSGDLADPKLQPAVFQMSRNGLTAAAEM